MKESAFGFEYDWGDLQPIRPLMWVLIAAQALGGALGLLMPHFPNWFESLWFGAAVATLPGFLVGLPVQAWCRPGSLGEHKVMVRRLGLVAVVLTVYAFAMPLLGFGQP